jgi:hypothetical protein
VLAPEDRDPRWPAWYAAAAFGVGLIVTIVVVGMVAAVTGTEADDDSPTFTIVATLVQSLVFLATAVGFASLSARPRAWHFGLRRTPLWPAVGWAALGMFAFYVFSIVYTVIARPDVEQGITESLGADEGTVGLIAAGLMVMVAAPVAEEVFFRGFFYRALRSRFAVPAAAAIDGLLFGIIHFDFSGLDALLLVPPLAVLGIVFCLVYEVTGSIFPVIALHALNNAIAYGAQADGWVVSAAVLPLMLASCVLVPRLLHPGPPRLAT